MTILSQVLLLLTGLALSAGAWFFRQLDKRIADLSSAVLQLSTDLGLMRVRSEELFALKHEFDEHVKENNKVHQRIIRVEERLKIHEEQDGA